MMSNLEKVLDRLKRKNEAYENERNNLDDDGMIDTSLACDLADSVSYLIKTIEQQKQENEQLKRKNENQLEILKDIHSMAMKGFNSDPHMALEDIFNKLESKLRDGEV